MCFGCKLGASVQNCVCLSVCQEYVGADGYVSTCINCTTCSSLRSPIFITGLVFVTYYLRMNETSPGQIAMHMLRSLANKLPCVLV